MSATLQSSRRGSSQNPVELSIGILSVDPSIGCDEALRRVRGLFDGTMQSGPASEAVCDFVDFRPFEACMSSSAPWLRERLRNVHGNWKQVFTELCDITLWPVNNAPECVWCKSRRQYHATKRDGQYLGVLCGNCGHGSINKSIVMRWREYRRVPR